MDEQNVDTTGVAVVEQSTALAPFIPPNADRALIEEVMAENLGATGMSEFDLQRIKVPGGGGIAFELQGPEGLMPATKFRAIILRARDTRSYWPNSIDESGGGQPPSCHSNDCITGIGSPGGPCAQCSLAQFGSAKKGGGQACKQTKQLFIARQNSGGLLPEVFNVPPTSLKSYRKFAGTLASRLTPVTGVIVEITLSKEKSDGGQEYSQAHFNVVGTLTADERAAVKTHAAMFLPLFDHTPTIENSPRPAARPAALEANSQSGGAF